LGDGHEPSEQQRRPAERASILSVAGTTTNLEIAVCPQRHSRGRYLRVLQADYTHGCALWLLFEEVDVSGGRRLTHD
jgi:hypothetical protein